MQKEWFREWFDSSYYHILYNTHNEAEAHAFLDALLNTLSPPAGAAILDLACGTGRHAIYLASKGFEVVGLDLSESVIAYARQFETDNLTFYSHDMRRLFRANYFDCVFNFFTSFGYFKTELEHLLTLRHIREDLKPGGFFVLDFFNSHYIRNNLVPFEEKIVESIVFQIHRWISDGFVYKKIEFETPEKTMVFEEKVRLFTAPELGQLFEKAGLQILHTYGNYSLQPFDEIHSPRLILISQKPV